jgi:hypothetical protein
MDNSFYTYAYLREDGTPYYIGKGKGKRAFDKSGHRVPVPARERILFLKVNICEEDALRHEVYMIALYGRKDRGTGILYNFTDGGEGLSGYVPSEETRKKLSNSLLGNTRRRGKPNSPETRQKISQANKGRIFANETREKLRQSLTGKSKSPEHRRKLREAALNRKPVSEETREKMSQSQRGRTHSLETREKMRQSNVGQTRSAETCEKIRLAKQNISPETREKLRQAALLREKRKREMRNT